MTKSSFPCLAPGIGEPHVPAMTEFHVNDLGLEAAMSVPAEDEPPTARHLPKHEGSRHPRLQRLYTDFRATRVMMMDGAT